MSKSKKCYSVYKEFVDAKGEKHTVLVYGELRLEHLNVRGRKVQLKCLNFGHAICSHNDEFNEEVGVKLAKKRFYCDPMCTFNHNFLNEDMVQAILNNEVDYIVNHLDKYLPKRKEA